MRSKRAIFVIGFILFFLVTSGRTNEDFFQDGVLSLLNTHSNKVLVVRYLDDDGQVDASALWRISCHLGSPETGESIMLDPHLLVTLDRLQDFFGRDKTLRIISAYRSPNYNSVLRSRSEGVAKNSYHVKGMAADIAVEGVPLETVCQYARSLQQGGVGFYAGRFVHVDVGPIRFW